LAGRDLVSILKASGIDNTIAVGRHLNENYPPRD